MIASRVRSLTRWWWTILPLATLVLPGTASAQTGSITGTVTNSVTGAPIAGVPIFVVRSDNLSDAGVTEAQTDASGVYTFTGPAGGYYVAAVPSEGSGGIDFVDEIFGGIRAPIDFPDLVDGTLVTVNPGNTATASFALLPAGHVTGTVTDASTGAPLANILVQSVYRYGNVGDYWLTDALTDASGHYELRGLAPGQIFLMTRSVNAPGYVDEYWANSPCAGPCGDSTQQVPAPTPTTIVSGVTVPGRDFALDPGGAVSGRVTNAATGQPITGLSMNVNAFVNGGLRPLGTVSTNSSGVYRFSGLATGTYFVSTGVGNSGYMNEVYDNILCPLGCNSIQSGTEIPVAVRQTTDNRDFALTTGGVITGTITTVSNGAPLQNVTVTAVTRVGANLLTRSATTNASGVYRLAGLPAGTYWLYTSNAGFYVNEIFNDIPCFGVGCSNTAAATLGAPIVVASGATVANQNFALVEGGFVTGTIHDSVTNDVIVGQTVELSMQSGSGTTFVTSTVTNPTGYFSFAGVTAGTYFLNTSGSTGYQNEIYNNIPCAGPTCANVGAGTPIPVTLGGAVNGRDFNLDPIAGGLRGRITGTATGLPLQGVTVNLYQRSGSGIFVTSTVTNYRGNYFFDSLPGGTYVVFTSNTLGYRNEIYNDIPCTGACSPATAAASGAAINVTATGWTSGIDFALDDRASAPAAPTNFRVVMTGTTAVFSWTAAGSNTTGAATGYVIDAGFSPGATAISVPAGSGTSFTIPSVPPGAFYVRVRAINAAGSSPPSNEVVLGMSAVGVALPEAPTGVQAFMQDGLLTMTWLQPLRGGPATGYIVEAGSATGLTNVGSVPVTTGRSLTFPGVPPGFYFLRVRAINAGGASAPSAEVMIVVGAVPAPPGAPNFTSHSVSGNTVTLNWAAPTSGTPTSYIVEAGSAPGLSNLAVANTGSTATTVSFTGVPPGTYYVRLRAVNAQGASVVSNERTIVVQ